MNCQEALCVSSPEFPCKAVPIWFFSGFWIQNFLLAKGNFKSVGNWVNLVSILSLTIWFWFSEPQNKPFLLIGKPTVSRFLPFLSFCFTFEFQTKVSQVFQFEFLLFYKNYIYFCWRFFGNVLPDIETEIWKQSWFAFLF